MRRAVLIIISILWVGSLGTVYADSGTSHQLKIDDIRELISLKSGLESNEKALSKISTVLEHLEKRKIKYKSEEAFLEYLYYYTHRKLLKSYTQYPTLAEALVSGNYDCLTATAIYSILLTELSVEHAVIETNYHIYILINPDTEKQILIETTDPRYGFVSDQEEIISSRDSYLRNNISERNTMISFDFNIERRLEQKELIGLLYFNQSIKELNAGDWNKARKIAWEAKKYYTETRVSTLLTIIDSPSL